MTFEEEEHVQNELALLQREAEAVRKLLRPELARPFTPFSQKAAISQPPVQLPSVPITGPEVPEGQVLAGSHWRPLTIHRILMILSEEPEQARERVALPA